MSPESSECQSKLYWSLSASVIIILIGICICWLIDSQMVLTNEVEFKDQHIQYNLKCHLGVVVCVLSTPNRKHDATSRTQKPDAPRRLVNAEIFHTFTVLWCAQRSRCRRRYWWLRLADGILRNDSDSSLFISRSMRRVIVRRPPRALRNGFCE